MRNSFIIICALWPAATCASCSGKGIEDAYSESDAFDDVELDLNGEESEDRTTYCSEWQAPIGALAYGALWEYTGASWFTNELFVVVIGGTYWTFTQHSDTREKTVYRVTTDGVTSEIPIAYEEPAGDHCSGLIKDIKATDTHFILLYDNCASLLSFDGVESNYIDISGESEGWQSSYGGHFVDSEDDISVIAVTNPDSYTEGFLIFRLSNDAVRLDEGVYVETLSRDTVDYSGWPIDQYPNNLSIKTSERLFAGFYGSNATTPESDHDVVYFALNADATLYCDPFKVPTAEYYESGALRFLVRAGLGAVLGWTSFTGPEMDTLHHLIYIGESTTSSGEAGEEVLVLTGSDTMEGISTQDRGSFILLTGSALPSVDHCIDFDLSTGWNPMDIAAGPADTYEVGGGIGFMDPFSTARMATMPGSIIVVWNDYWHFDETDTFYTATNYIILPSE